MDILPLPLIWRKLLQSYIKGLILSMSAFILILLTLRLNDIAHFATLGSSGKTLLEFTLYQVAYVLPFALPIGSFISSFILVQSLVDTQELTALRALGLSLKDLLFPILSAASLFGLINFILISEVASQSSFGINTLKNEIRDVNPLLLLQNKQLLGLKGITATSLGSSKISEFAEDVVLTIPTKQKNDTHLVIAKRLRNDEGNLFSDHLTLIGSFTHTLIIDNVKKTKTTTTLLSSLFQDQKTALQNDQLKLSQLLSQADKTTGYQRTRCHTELLRRLSAGLSVLTYSFLALSFALSTNRLKTKQNLILALSLIALYLLTTILAKETRSSLNATFFLLFAPQILSIILSYKNTYYFSKGTI